jgi:AcrR family transcriptional regulator
MASSRTARGVGVRVRPSPTGATGKPGHTARAARPGARIAGTVRVPGTQVSDVQRGRMIRAAAEVVGELGYGGMSVARITSRAGVSRRTFYDLFDDREACFLAVFEEVLARASSAAREGTAGMHAWRERVRAGLCALLVLFDEEPLLGSLVVVDALAAGPLVLERRARVLNRLTAIVDEGRTEMPSGEQPPPLTAEGVVGAVLAVVHARMLEREPHEPHELLGLLNALMGMVVLPYLGRAAAEEELGRPLPQVSRAPRAGGENPLAGLEMRLTYRTLRVLAAIAQQPGASNRQIADIAGVQDQGQISKLLARLEVLGLAENRGRGQARGEPNAWSLTAKGTEVAQTVQSAT